MTGDWMGVNSSSMSSSNSNTQSSSNSNIQQQQQLHYLQAVTGADAQRGDLHIPAIGSGGEADQLRLEARRLALRPKAHLQRTLGCLW